MTELVSEKYLKRLIGRTEIEDALKRLDRLTQEEARMATAQILKLAHTVDENVREIRDEVLGIDNRVAGVDDRVASVGEIVKTVDDKVTALIDGAQYTSNQSLKSV